VSLEHQIAYMRERGVNGPHLVDYLRDVATEEVVHPWGIEDNPDRALQDAAKRAYNGGIVVLPCGEFEITEAVDWGSARVFGAGPGGVGTTIFTNQPIVCFRLSGSYGELNNIHFRGNYRGGVGALVGESHKPFLARCTAEGFTTAGFAFSGAQNMMALDCFAKFCLYDFLITNNARNLQFLNCNATDSDQAGSVAPFSRAVMIGQVANDYVTQLDAGAYTNWPSRIIFRGGIFERFSRHDYIVEISHGYDNVLFDDCEFTAAKTSYVKIGKGVLAQAVFREPVWRSSNVPLIVNEGSVPVAVQNSISGGGAPVWQN
jgi:hypothetical protein